MTFNEAVEKPREVEQRPQKRNIEGYEEKFCIELAGKYVVLAENPTADDPYLVCNVKYDNPLGLEERYDGTASDNYIEAMREFVNRVDGMLGTLETERCESGLPLQTLTAADCIPGSENADFEGKLIIIKPEILSPEYRSSQHQLALCTGGFGASANARGTAVFAEELYSGKKCGYRRHQIAGLADPSKLPEWAVDKLTEYQKKDELGTKAEITPQADKNPKEKAVETPKKKPTLQEKLDNAKQKVRDNAAQKDDGGKKSKKKDREAD